MSFSLILLAAGNSHRFKSKIGKPYQKLAGKSLIEINLHKALQFKQIKKIIIVYNKKDLKKVKSLKLKNIKLIAGGKTRQQSTLKALEHLINQKSISNVLIHDVARPNFSKKLFSQILKNMKNSRAVIPKIKIQDAIKEVIDSSKEEYILGKNRDNLFLTQTPQAFNLKEIYKLHQSNALKYKDDDISLYMDLNKVKFKFSNITKEIKNGFIIFLSSMANIQVNQLNPIIISSLLDTKAVGIFADEVLEKESLLCFADHCL